MCLYIADLTDVQIQNIYLYVLEKKKVSACSLSQQEARYNNYGKQSFHLEAKIHLTVVHPYLKTVKFKSKDSFQQLHL